MENNKSNEVKKLTPIKAIKAKCLDCCCGDRGTIKECPVKDCPLWGFRLGKNPNRTARVLTDEQRAAAAKRLAQARERKMGVRKA